MKNLIISLVVFLTQIFNFTLNTNNCLSQWVPTIGPHNGSGNCSAISGNNLFVGSNGVFLTTNNGGSWSAAGLANQSINKLAILGSILFAGTNDSGVYSSTNKGTNWIRITNGLPSNMSVTVLTVLGTNIFAGFFNGLSSLYISTNNGANWTGISSHHTLSLAISGTNIFAGTYSDGVFLSTNNGSNWTPINNGLTGLALTIRSLLVVGSNIFAGTPWGIYKSTDNGGSWNQSNNGILQANVSCLTVLGTNILAGEFSYNRGIFLSTNSGASWSQLNNGLIGSSLVIYFLQVSGTNIFAGTLGGVSFSSNNGTNWTSVGLMNYTINSFAVLTSTSGNRLYSGTYGGGIFFSSNFGSSWTQVNNGLTNKRINALIVTPNASGKRIFAGTEGNGVFLSTNSGTSWTPYNSGLQSLYIRALSGIQTGTFSTLLFAGTNGVYRSADNGASWTSANNGLTSGIVNTFLVTETNIFAGTNSGVFLSTNSGTYWTVAGLSSKDINALAVSGTNLFAGVGIYPYGIFLSTNNGINWEDVSTGLPNLPIRTLVVSGTNLFAGVGNDITGGGVYMTSNNGGSWIQKNQGFNVIPSVGSIFIENDYLFAGTGGQTGLYGQSVWRRTLSEIIGIKQVSEFIPNNYSLSQNYPNPFNPTTNIEFSLTEKSFVKMIVFDITGKEVAELVNENLSAGTFRYEFNAENLPSGLYFYKLVTDKFSKTKRMILIK